MEAIGQLTTEQNIATSPIAAPNPVFNPIIDATRFPNVAPIKKVGTISPPLNPAPRVSAVNIILSKNASGLILPVKAFSITGIPAPLKSLVPTNNVSTINIIPPVIILKYSYVNIIS